MAGERRNSAHHLNTINTPTNLRAPQTLPPDVAAARKSRIDNDFMTLFKRPCPPNTQPTAQGNGLYTHVKGTVKTPQFAQENYTQSNPVFLPVGGPRRIGQGIRRDPQVTGEVKEAWKALKEAIDEEEKVIGGTEMTAEELKARYGDIVVLPSLPDAQMQRLQFREQDVSMQDANTDRTNPAPPGGVGRRLSLGGPIRRQSATRTDVNMGGTGPARRGSLPRTGNIYHENRDPRLQRR